LSILELDNRRVLYRLFSDAEHPRCYLRNHMISIRDNIVRITSLTSRHESIQLLRSPRPRENEIQADRSKRHPTTVDRHRNLDLLTILSLVQRDRKINVLLI